MLAVMIKDVYYADSDIIDMIKTGDFLGMVLKLRQGLNPNAYLTIQYGGGKYQDPMVAIAIEHGNYEFFELLIEHGAHPNTVASSRSGRPLIHHVARSYKFTVDEKKKALDLLLKHGARPTSRDSQGNTLLHLSYFLQQLDQETMDRIMGLGIDVNLKDHRGNTPLNSILFQKVTPWIEDFALRLVKQGALLDIPNKLGHTPMDRLNLKPKKALKEKVMAIINER